MACQAKPVPGSLGYAMIQVRRLEREADWLARQCSHGAGYCPCHAFDLGERPPAWCSFRPCDTGGFTCDAKDTAACWRKMAETAAG